MNFHRCISNPISLLLLGVSLIYSEGSTLKSLSDNLTANSSTSSKLDFWNLPTALMLPLQSYTYPVLEEKGDNDVDTRGGGLGGGFNNDFGRKLLYLLPLLFVVPLLFLFCKHPRHEYYHYPPMYHQQHHGHHGGNGHGWGHGGHEEYYDAGHGSEGYHKKVGLDHYLGKGSNLIHSLTSGSTELLNKLSLKG